MPGYERALLTSSGLRKVGPELFEELRRSIRSARCNLASARTLFDLPAELHDQSQKIQQHLKVQQRVGKELGQVEHEGTSNDDKGGCQPELRRRDEADARV